MTKDQVESFKNELDEITWDGLREQFIIKETITRTEAQELADQTKRAFFKPLEEMGIYVEESMPDGSGEPFTKERVDKINREFDSAICSHNRSWIGLNLRSWNFRKCKAFTFNTTLIKGALLIQVFFDSLFVP